MSPSEPNAPRVLMATPRSPLELGGVERHVREVSTRLAAEGVAVRVLCAEPGAPRTRAEDMDGVPVTIVPAYPKDRDWFWAPGIREEIQAGSADLIHVQSYHTLLPPMVMARAQRLGIPYVLTFHGGGHSANWRNQVRGLQRRAIGPLLRRAERLIAVAPFEVSVYGAELKLGPERFALIPNGTELALDPAQGVDAPLAPVQPSDPVVLASIGRLERYKGHHRAIAAMPALLQRYPQAKLLIVGQGPYEAELRELAAQSAARERIEFTSVPPGDPTGMGRLLGGVDLVVLMSDLETHPITALEAASARRRLVVARSRGLSELADEGFATAVAPEAEPAQVASVISDALSRPGPDKVPELSSWDDCAAALLSMYQQVTLEAVHK